LSPERGATFTLDSGTDVPRPDIAPEDDPPTDPPAPLPEVE